MLQSAVDTPVRTLLKRKRSRSFLHADAAAAHLQVVQHRQAFSKLATPRPTHLPGENPFLGTVMKTLVHSSSLSFCPHRVLIICTEGVVLTNEQCWPWPQ